MMITNSFWVDDYPRPVNLPVSSDLPTEVDVAIVGGGYNGLNAAYWLAKSGAKVAVLERETIGWGASSRNAGITGCGLKRGMPAIFKRYGPQFGEQFWQASIDALGLIDALVEDEGIDCDWQMKGGLGVAFKPSHYEGYKDYVNWHRETLDHELELIDPSEMQSVIGSQAYPGGYIDLHGASLHPTKLVFGLAEVAARYGAQLVEYCGVNQIEKNGDHFLLRTMKGEIKSADILVATNGYTDKMLPGLKPKILPVGSYSIVTEPLSAELQAELCPKGYVMWDSKWLLNYFRLTPDGRMLWGGRNNLSTELDLSVSAKILQSQMVRAFPQLRDISITHTWSGKLGVTFDLMPHIGRQNGIFYSFGNGGHGLHSALYMGKDVAQMLTGEKTSSPFMEIPHETHFFYRDKTWFLPFAAYFYRFKDWLS